MGKHKVLNTPAIRRVPTYLHKLMLMHAAGEEFVSTSKLADYMDLDPIIVRKDFELTGIQGTPGVGFKTADLIAALRRFLGWDERTTACLVGAGSLGSALLGYEEFAEYGLRFMFVFDSDSRKHGLLIHAHEVLDVRKMRQYLASATPDIGIICVPSSTAQMVADELVQCGVKAIWNFANVCLKVPHDVIVQREVIAGGFALLSMKRRSHGTATGQDD